MNETGVELHWLFREMRPRLHERPVVFCSIPTVDLVDLPIELIGLFREDERITIIVSADEADKAGLAYSGRRAHITLRVYSPLGAVVFIVAVINKLARNGISANHSKQFRTSNSFDEF